MTQHIDALLKRKRAERQTIAEALRLSPARHSRQWQRWLAKNAEECAALAQAREALLGLTAVKRAAKQK